MQQVGPFVATCENKMSRCNADAEITYKTLILEDYHAIKVTLSCCIITVIRIKIKTWMSGEGQNSILNQHNFSICLIIKRVYLAITLPETNIASENGWTKAFPKKTLIFQTIHFQVRVVSMLLVSGRVQNTKAQKIENILPSPGCLSFFLEHHGIVFLGAPWDHVIFMSHTLRKGKPKVKKPWCYFWWVYVRGGVYISSGLSDGIHPVVAVVMCLSRCFRTHFVLLRDRREFALQGSPSQKIDVCGILIYPHVDWFCMVFRYGKFIPCSMSAWAGKSLWMFERCLLWSWKLSLSLKEIVILSNQHSMSIWIPYPYKVGPYQW